MLETNESFELPKRIQRAPASPPRLLPNAPGNDFHHVNRITIEFIPSRIHSLESSLCSTKKKKKKKIPLAAHYRICSCARSRKKGQRQQQQRQTSVLSPIKLWRSAIISAAARSHRASPGPRCSCIFKRAKRGSGRIGAKHCSAYEESRAISAADIHSKRQSSCS